MSAEDPTPYTLVVADGQCPSAAAARLHVGATVATGHGTIDGKLAILRGPVDLTVPGGVGLIAISPEVALFPEITALRSMHEPPESWYTAGLAVQMVPLP